jgi:hypothetical protein
MQLIFAATDSRDLMAALNLQFSRLEKVLGAVAAKTLWEDNISWFQGQSELSNVPILRWTLDDCFTLTIEDQELRFLRLEGNSPSAKAGLMEYPGSKYSLSDVAQCIISIVADGLLSIDIASNHPPLTVQIRSLFFDEMLKISQSIDGDLDTVRESLRSSGWHFAGGDESWDRFLRTRQQSRPINGEDRKLQRCPPINWDITSWRHAKIEAKKASTQSSTNWNATAIGQHLALFLGILTELAALDLTLDDKRIADTLAGHALGLPDSMGTTLTFLQQKGRRRIQHYARMHWPHIELDGTVYGR